MKQKWSAGILMYRRRNRALEVLLVHPGGPFWANKDEGAWSIPKGEHGNEDDALAAARREFLEETGSAIDGVFTPLTPVKQPGGKTVRAFAIEGELDPQSIVSNTFTLEWPPRSRRNALFPEIDRAAWFSIEEAERKLLGGQRPLLAELCAVIDAELK